jgi:hypothetical protein
MAPFWMLPWLAVMMVPPRITTSRAGAGCACGSGAGTAAIDALGAPAMLPCCAAQVSASGSRHKTTVDFFMCI